MNGPELHAAPAGDDDVVVVELVPHVPGTREAHPLREIAFRADAWLPSEIALLDEMFRRDCTFEEIAEALGRPIHGVADRAWRIGLRRQSRRAWNELEDQLLCREYGKQSAALLGQELGRSASSVYIRAAWLGLSNEAMPPWSPWEDAQLQEGYRQALPVAQIAALIGRTLCATNSRAHKLGIRHPHQPGDWSDAEMQRALELAEEGHRYLKIIELLAAEGFPRRSKNGFGQRIRILGYGRGWGRAWTIEEEDMVRRAYQTGASLVPLRALLCRTQSSIKWKAEQLGLQGTHEKTAGFRQGPVWTTEEEDFLRANYGVMKTRELAERLGRPRMGVLNRAWTMGLKHGYWRPYTQEELHAFRVAFDHGVAIADLAITLERHPMTVSKYATDKLGLHFGRRKRRKPPVTLAEILALQPEVLAA